MKSSNSNVTSSPLSDVDVPLGGQNDNNPTGEGSSQGTVPITSAENKAEDKVEKPDVDKGESSNLESTLSKQGKSVVDAINSHYIDKYIGSYFSSRDEHSYGQRPLIDTNFINLVIADKETVGRTEQDIQKSLSRYISSPKAIVQQDHIPVKDIFMPIEASVRVRKVVIFGKPGTGKSTLCQHIALQCRDKKLWAQKFDSVIYLQFKEIIDWDIKDETELNNIEKLARFILERYIPKLSSREVLTSRNPSTDDIRDYLINNGNKILFILDGYDEGKHQLDQKPLLREVINFILTDEQFNVILTSRPIVIKLDKRDAQFDKILENVGFTPNCIKNYVEKFFTSPDIAEQVWERISRDPNILNIASVPLNLDLICRVWRSSPIDEFSHNIIKELTVTLLYQKMVEELLNYHASKSYERLTNSDNKEETKVNDKGKEKVTEENKGTEKEHQESDDSIIEKKETIIELLEAIAEYGINNNKTYLCESEIATILTPAKKILGEDVLNQLINTGILKKALSADDDYKITFIHQTFQEFFAAKKIVRGFLEFGDAYQNSVQALKDHKYDPYYEVIWQRTVGLLADQYLQTNDKLPLLMFWDIFENEPHELLGFIHNELAIKLLNEIPRKAKNKIAEIENLVMRFIDKGKICSDSFSIIKSNQHPASVKLYAIETIVKLQLVDKNKEIDKEAIDTLIHARENYCGSSALELYAAEALLRLGQISDKSIMTLTYYITYHSKNLGLAKYSALAIGSLKSSGKLPEARVNDILLKALTTQNPNINKIKKFKILIAEALLSKNSTNWNSNYHQKALDYLIKQLKNRSLQNYVRKALTRCKKDQRVLDCLSKLKDSLDAELVQDIIQILNSEPQPINKLSIILKEEHSKHLIKRSEDKSELLKDAGKATLFLTAYGGGLKLATHYGLIESPDLKYMIWGGFSVFIAMGAATFTANLYNQYPYLVNSLDAKVLNSISLEGGLKQEAIKQISELVNIRHKDKVIMEWSKRGILNLSMAIQLFSSTSDQSWLKPMKDIKFIHKYNFLLVIENGLIVEYKRTIEDNKLVTNTSLQLTKNLDQTIAVLTALRIAYSSQKLPTYVFDYYLQKTSLNTSTQEQKDAYFTRSLSNAHKVRTLRTLKLTELHIATTTGNFEETIRILKEQKININDQNNEEQETPLISAIKGEHWNIVQLLVETGADVNLGNAINVARKHSAKQTYIDLMVEKSFINEDILRQVLFKAVKSYKLQKTPEAREKILDRLAINLTGDDRDWKNSSQYINLYHLYLGNIRTIEGERIGYIKAKAEGATITLKMRLHTYLELFMKIAAKKIKDDFSEGFDYEKTKSGLYIEIKLLSQTYIIEKIASEIIGDSKLMETHFSILLKHLLSLEYRQEYVIRTGNDQHCIYVSFYKWNDEKLLIRIDNRYLSGGIDSRKHGIEPWLKKENQYKDIRAYCFGVFNLNNNDDCKHLKNYIKEILNTERSPDEQLPHIYGAYLPNNIVLPYDKLSQDIQEYIRTWPYHNIQENHTDNCTLSSYNLGISVRHGMPFFEWLRNKERQLLPPLSAEPTRISSSSSRTSTSRLGGGGSSNAVVVEPSAVTTYSHIELMKKFQRELNVDYSEITFGIAVEQALVKLAKISISQAGANFSQRNCNNTIFHLKFASSVEQQQFLDYYNQRFPELITQPAILGNDSKMSVIMNTRLLYNEVSVAFGALTQTTKENNKEITNAI